MLDKGDKMSIDLKEIAIKTEEINKDFSEALEILKELFKNGVKPSEESIKNAINEVLIGFNFIKENELKEKLEILLEELNINANIDEEVLKENLLNIILENKESLKGDKGENGKSAYELWLEIKENAGKSKDEFLESLKGDKGDKGDSSNSSLKTIQISNGKKLRVEFSTKQTSSAYPLKTLTLSRLGIKLAGDDEFLKLSKLNYVNESLNYILLGKEADNNLYDGAEYIQSSSDFDFENTDISKGSFAKVKINSSPAFRYGNRYTPYYAFRFYDNTKQAVYLANNALKDPFYIIECELSKPIKEFKFTPWGTCIGGAFFSENLNIKIYIDNILFKEINLINPNSKEIDTDFTIDFNIQGDKLIYDEFRDNLEDKFREIKNKFALLGV